MRKTSTTLIIIPAYNEEETIDEVVRRAKRYADVCVINDNSNDSTPHILADIEGIHVIHHTVNTHIPGGICDGMEYAVNNNYDYAITMDAGLSHNPDDIPRFLGHSPCDLLIGTRTTKRNTPLSRKFLSAAGNFIYNISLDFPGRLFMKPFYGDLTSGFRRYSNIAMTLILSKNMQSKSFEIMLETASHIFRKGMSISEISIIYNFSNSSLNPKVIFDCIKMASKMCFVKS